MSYNWQDASTPQGRERLFQILKECGHVGLHRVDLNLFDFIRREKDRFGTQMFCGLIDREDNIHAYQIDEYIAEHGENLLFLDPSPNPNPDENGLLQTILNLPEYISLAYIKAMIRDTITKKLQENE